LRVSEDAEMPNMEITSRVCMCLFASPTLLSAVIWMGETSENFLFWCTVLVYMTEKYQSQENNLKLCYVHRNKSLTKSRYGDDISNTKRGKVRDGKKEKHKTNHRKSKSAPITSQIDLRISYSGVQYWYM